MDEYSSLGSNLIILPPADRVLKVSPKRGPGDRKAKKKKEEKKDLEHPPRGQKMPQNTHSSADDDSGDAKGMEVDIVI